MAASVRDLIEAAQASQKPNPLASGLSAFTQGFGGGALQDPLSTAMKLAQIRQFQDEQKKLEIREKERQVNIAKMEKEEKTGRVSKKIEIGPEGTKVTFADKETGALLTPEQSTAFAKGDIEGFIQSFPQGIPMDIMKEFQNNLSNLRKVQAKDEGLTEAQKTADKEFAKEYASFSLAGGNADVEKNIKQLDNVAKKLRASRGLTGPVVGSVPKAVRARINPESVNVQEQVEEVVQRNLRLILGAQFTEREGIRLIERAFNPALDESINADRVERLAKQIRSAAKAKTEAGQYLEKHGTLRGFKGTVVSGADEFLLDEGQSQNIGEIPTGLPRIINIRPREK